MISQDNLLIHDFLHALCDRSCIAYPLVSIANIAIISNQKPFLFLNFGDTYPILLHPRFLPELKTVLETARDVLEIDCIRIDARTFTVVITYKDGRYYQERVNGTC